MLKGLFPKDFWFNLVLQLVFSANELKPKKSNMYVNCSFFQKIGIIIFKVQTKNFIEINFIGTPFNV